jgi:SAM-dependent methyltransferase
MKKIELPDDLKISTGYRDSHLSPKKGESYHKTFFENPYRSLVWEFERAILDRILSLYYAGQEIHHLDFACGTGRVLIHCEDRTSTSVGIDLSPSMLEVANKNSKNSELHQADLTREDVLGNRKFNLITAFRFFPNAEPELRFEAMEVLVKHLDENGYLVFNNHKNLGSFRYRLARLFGRGGKEGMSISDVKELLAKNDMDIVKTYHLCVFPASENHMLLPRSILRHIEGALARCPVFRNLAENILFVCQHANKRS